MQNEWKSKKRMRKGVTNEQMKERDLFNKTRKWDFKHYSVNWIGHHRCKVNRVVDSDKEKGDTITGKAPGGILVRH